MTYAVKEIFYTLQGEGANATWAERVLKDDEVIASALLPGLAATVADLWAGV